MSYIVNFDVSHYLLSFLSFNDLFCFLRLNHSFYQLVSASRLFQELLILKKQEGDKLKACIKFTRCFNPIIF